MNQGCQAFGNFFITTGGYEYTLVLAVAALTLAFTGPGSLSVEALFRYSDSGAFWGMAAVVVGVLGGIVALIQRKAAPTAQTRAGE